MRFVRTHVKGKVLRQPVAAAQVTDFLCRTGAKLRANPRSNDSDPISRQTHSGQIGSGGLGNGDALVRRCGREPVRATVNQPEDVSIRAAIKFSGVIV